MPRFYFDFSENGIVHPDFEGTELVGSEEARLEVLDIIRDVAKDEVPAGPARHYAVKVREADGPALITISLVMQVDRPN